MSRAGLRVDLYRVAPRNWWRWRLWSSSRIVGQSSESYVKRSAAISNLESLTGGRFEKTSTPDEPTPFGLLHRDALNAIDAERDRTWQNIPVRLVT